MELKGPFKNTQRFVLFAWLTSGYLFSQIRITSAENNPLIFAALALISFFYYILILKNPQPVKLVIAISIIIFFTILGQIFSLSLKYFTVIVCIITAFSLYKVVIFPILMTNYGRWLFRAFVLGQLLIYFAGRASFGILLPVRGYEDALRFSGSFAEPSYLAIVTVLLYITFGKKENKWDYFGLTVILLLAGSFFGLIACLILTLYNFGLRSLLIIVPLIMSAVSLVDTLALVRLTYLLTNPELFMAFDSSSMFRIFLFLYNLWASILNFGFPNGTFANVEIIDFLQSTSINLDPILINALNNGFISGSVGADIIRNSLFTFLIVIYFTINSVTNNYYKFLLIFLLMFQSFSVDYPFWITFFHCTKSSNWKGRHAT